MKLGLLGFPIEHSLSPKLYRELLGAELTSYELFSFATPGEIPPLDFFSQKLQGLNITSPYKTHFVAKVKIPSPLVQQIGAVNTLAFTEHGTLATNTDLLAVEEILQNLQTQYGQVELIILGDGVMAQVTKLVARSLNITFEQFSRRLTPDFLKLNLAELPVSSSQVVVINSCARGYIYQGSFRGNEIFWDYNYRFLPHEERIPALVKSYHDGQEMLERQAKAAIKFWNEVIPKLK